jgi:hypothetical protein
MPDRASSPACEGLKPAEIAVRLRLTSEASAEIALS